MGLVLVVSLVTLRITGLRPLLPVLAGHYQCVIDELLIGEPPDFFGTERAVRGQVLDGACEDVDFDAHIVD